MTRRRIEVWVDVDEDVMSEDQFESLRKTLEKLSWWARYTSDPYERAS